MGKLIQQGEKRLRAVDNGGRLLTFHIRSAQKTADTFQHIETRQFGRRVSRPILDSDTGGKQVTRSELLHPVPALYTTTHAQKVLIFVANIK